MAIGSAGTGVDAVTVFAYQIDGVSGGPDLRRAPAGVPSGGGGSITHATVAGRTVTEVAAASETTYIYLAGDVVFILGGALTAERLEDAVSQLPAG